MCAQPTDHHYWSNMKINQTDTHRPSSSRFSMAAVQAMCAHSLVAPYFSFKTNSASFFFVVVRYGSLAFISSIVAFVSRASECVYLFHIHTETR